MKTDDKPCVVAARGAPVERVQWDVPGPPDGQVVEMRKAR